MNTLSLQKTSIGTGQAKHSESILKFLEEKGEASKRTISIDCFKRNLPAAKIDAALGSLLSDLKVELREVKRADKRGTPTKFYRLRTNTPTNSTNCDNPSAS